MNAMGTVNRNYLIKLDNAKQADEVFDVLHSLGEPIRTTTFIYNPDWCYVGFYNLSNNWTIAREDCFFGSNVISFENFMKTFSSKDTVKKSDVEDYTGKTIKALVNSPQSTGVQIGEEIKILKLNDGGSRYVLDKNAKGFSCMLINRPLNLTEWELVEESITKVDMKAIQEECKKRFPIGCTYQDPGDKIARVLRQDYSTYNINGDKHIYANKYIYAHGGGGCLYKNGVYATLVSLPEKKTIKQNFIVGRWYKYKDWYIKYKETVGGIFKCSEQINDDRKYNKYDGFFGEADHNKVLLEDLSEIQQYLPDGHPDKITPSIPEYVEYIDTKYKGQIVKVEDWRCLSYCKVIFHDGNREQPFKHLVKHSTKEAYDAQFTTLHDVCSKGVENLIEKETDSLYAYVGDPLPTKKPLIEDVHSVSVKLSTKKKTNKLIF
jgi:hypothetical protein